MVSVASSFLKNSFVKKGKNLSKNRPGLRGAGGAVDMAFRHRC